MMPRDLRQLLGGYAAGTLTPQEREALFQAALDDQALFDALADEEALRELLADPIARARLLEELAPPPGFWHRLAAWMRKPAPLAFAGATAALVMVVGVVRYAGREALRPQLVAQAPRPVETRAPAAPPVNAPKAPEARVARRPAPPPEPAPRSEPEPEKLVAAKPAPVVAEARVAPRPAPPSPSEPERLAAGKPAAVVAEAVRADAPRDSSASFRAPPALDYTLLVQDPEGAWRETSPTRAFHPGDRVRLRVRPAQDGYLQVTAQDGSLVTPLSPPGGAPVMRGQELVLPLSGALELAGSSGEKLLRMSLLPGPPAQPQVGMTFAEGAGAVARKTRADAAAAPASAPSPAPPPAPIDLRLVYRPK